MSRIALRKRCVYRSIYIFKNRNFTIIVLIIFHLFQIFFQISAADRGKILILNLAAALDADNCDIRFRELELPESDLNAASPLSLPQFNGALNLTRTGRTLDSRAATSSSVIQILETYTLRLSISPILLINEFQAHHMCDYEKLESNM